MTEVELHIQIRRNGRLFLNATTAKLLQEVERCGSLRIAARGLHYSYQHAWNLIDGINRVASQPVVLKQRGGSGGGGARLSPHGRILLDEFRNIERLVKSFAKKMNAEMNL